MSDKDSLLDETKEENDDNKLNYGSLCSFTDRYKTKHYTRTITQVCLEFCSWRGFICCVILPFSALLGHDLSKIVIGAVYYHDCTAEPGMPLMLIISGTSMLVVLFVVVLFILSSRRDDRKEKNVTAITWFIGLTSALLFLARSLWQVSYGGYMFSKYNGHYQITPGMFEEGRTCSPVLWSFTVITIFTEYAELGVLLIALLYVSCLVNVLPSMS